MTKRSTGNQQLVFTVLGVPAPKGSLRTHVTHTRSGQLKAVAFEDNARTKPWREAVAWRAIEAAGAQGWQCTNEAVAVEITFRMPRPKRIIHPKPSAKPDLDKLVRCVLDALQDTHRIFKDDSRVTKIAAEKRYIMARRHEPFEEPGAVIRVLEAEHVVGFNMYYMP